jgi:hypothetical protein
MLPALPAHLNNVVRAHRAYTAGSLQQDQLPSKEKFVRNQLGLRRYNIALDASVDTGINASLAKSQT